MYAEDKLIKRIETLRNKLANTALEQGFTSTEVIITSQQLDRLLNIYHSLKVMDNSEYGNRR